MNPAVASDQIKSVKKVGAPVYVALTGNPNCGKTTVFNALTGLRAKVGNYAGVTVERKEGRLRGTPSHVSITLLDLPGTYSLSPKSLDEQISRDVLFNRLHEVPQLNLVVIVVDASNLERNLYYATQAIELRRSPECGVSSPFSAAMRVTSSRSSTGTLAMMMF